jgi:glycosyltransferase involved in cell wall biosynthesis
MTDQRDRLRVLIVATWYPSGSTMGGTFVADQVDALRSRFDVAVVAPERSGWRKFSVHQLRSTQRAPGDTYRPIARAWIPRLPGPAGRAYEAAVERAYRYSVQEVRRPDIIHAHVTFPGGFAAAKVGQRHGIPVVLTEHQSEFATHLGSRYAEEAAGWTLRHVSRVIAVSPSLREEILRFSPGCRVDVVGNVIDTEFFAPGSGARGLPRVSPERPLRILTIGLNAPIKGVDVLLEAMRLLADGDLSVELVVAGDGPSRAGLQDRCRRLGLEDRCRFVGSLSRPDIRKWLHWCDLYVSASRYETFGVAIAEALACARPVVVTRSGGPESFVEPEFGVVVEPGDPEALAAAVRETASGTRPLDGDIGRRRISERFGREAFLANVSAIYDDVIS